MSRDKSVAEGFANFGEYPTLEPDGMPPSKGGHLARYQQAKARQARAGTRPQQPDPDVPMAVCSRRGGQVQHGTTATTADQHQWPAECRR